MPKFIEWEEWEPLNTPDPGPPPTHEVTGKHWLEVFLSEEDEDTWSEGYDYEVSHECKWVDVGGYWHPGCTLQFEMDNIGVDVLDPEGDYWPKPPFKVEIVHFYHTYRTYEGDYDVESWVEIVK